MGCTGSTPVREPGGNGNASTADATVDTSARTGRKGLDASTVGADADAARAGAGAGAGGAGSAIHHADRMSHAQLRELVSPSGGGGHNNGGGLRASANSSLRSLNSHSQKGGAALAAAAGAAASG
jgi:hypothetical protein